MAKNSKAKIAANNRYTAKAYDRINLCVPKGRKSAIEARAEECKEKVNSYLNRLIREDMGLTDAEWKDTQDEKEWKFIVLADIVPKSEE